MILDLLNNAPLSAEPPTEYLAPSDCVLFDDHVVQRFGIFAWFHMDVLQAVEPLH